MIALQMVWRLVRMNRPEYQVRGIPSTPFFL
jgi:hypothetical protein